MSHLSLIRLAGAAAAVLLLVVAGPARADSFDDDLLGLINSYRAERELGRLAMKPELTRLALDHSRAMKRSGKLSHDGFKGRFRKAAAGGARSCVENVGWNYPTAAGQFEGWRTSPGHNTNMLDPAIKTAGIARSGAYTTFFACY